MKSPGAAKWCNLFLSMILLVSCGKTKEDYFKSAKEKSGSHDYAGAISDYSKIIESDPQDADAYQARGYVKRLSGDYIGAIQDYSKSIELRPTDGAPYVGRGMTKISMGDKEGGCVDLSKGLERGYAKAADLMKENCK